ncbi:3-(3-hydroxy-phenyl)propionate hydroxylase [Nocardiopsis sp. Huas11]|uniref:FAD-dependent monooxygenase n=1 Tax=Nocardiopsis sp. Huas11 TaxID=2183912 RepID=UPI000F1DC338|nr:FAD-dependent monooxygenase [Nocardiopsis sp. Huas11]RKS09669.1 3-(3-hydroxy-phenyl)propionate hydroxylase [Nocardiopsis sp. Huas11]
MKTTVPVLVVGAGPTGLALACELLRQGIDCRVIDKAAERPTHQARALTMWDGALDVLGRHGIADEVVSRGMPMTAARYWSRGRNFADVRFGEYGQGAASPVIITQPAVEEVMRDRLAALGGRVEWGTRLSGLTDRGTHVDAVLEGPDGPERLTASWLVGCDGNNSTVREQAGIAFGGSTYGRSFILGDGDIDHDLTPGEAHYVLHTDGVLVVVPLPDGKLRVFADATNVGDLDTAPSTAEIQRLADERAPFPLKVRDLQWSTRFQVHLRQATRYRKGRCLVAGDAAHVHSPAGGQGLNTGIQDAANLAWKLALVLEDRAGSDTLLDSYQAEREPVAAAVMRSSHQQTRLWTMRSPITRALRDALMGRAARSGLLERRMIPAMAQIDLDYTASPAVGEGGGRRALVRGLPDTDLVPIGGGPRTRLSALLADPRHTLVVLPGGDTAGARRAVEAAAPLADRLQTLVLLTDAEAGADADALAGAYRLPGGHRGAEGDLAGRRLVLVRPDGYVAGAAATLDPDDLLRPLVPSTAHVPGPAHP